MLKFIIRFLKAINSNQHPGEIAHAVCLGMILGFMPKTRKWNKSDAGVKSSRPDRQQKNHLTLFKPDRINGGGCYR